MVCAILDGRKTQTRRVVKPQPTAAHHFVGFTVSSTHTADEGKAVWARGPAAALLTDAHRVRCPYGAPGSKLWVRETWNGPFFTEDEAADVDDMRVFKVPERCKYKADGAPTPEYMDADDNLVCKWRPSIYMPRWASRITLEITAVRVELLGIISHEDALAEGVSNVDEYKELWTKIKGTWSPETWVWVVDFRLVSN